MCMAIKSDAKIEEELNCRLKIDINFTDFDPNTQKV